MLGATPVTRVRPGTHVHTPVARGHDPVWTFFHTSYWHLVLGPFLTGPEILRLAEVSRALRAHMGPQERCQWVAPTDDPRFGMFSVPLHPVHTVGRIQRLFPRNTGYCITSRVHLQAGIQQKRFRAFRENVGHAVDYLSLQDDRPVWRRQISLVGAWVSKGTGGGNIGPGVLKNTHGIVFRLHESAYCPNTCTLPPTIENPDEVCRVFSDRHQPSLRIRVENPNASPLYNWTLEDPMERPSVGFICVITTITTTLVAGMALILWILVSGTGHD